MLTVVTGPPCSGKSTWVETHATPGDIVIDFDKLALALGAAASHDYPPHIREVVFAARAAAITATLAACQQPGISAWIIDSSPTSQRRREYQAAGAQYVTLAAGRAELHRRADADQRPPRTHKVIDQIAARSDVPVTASRRW